ncbi:MAG: hypothetical protein CMA31_00145 [Euryarchaeota archaeon]|nr:hypothetical protein [Euryarchaeota archaeon]
MIYKKKYLNSIFCAALLFLVSCEDMYFTEEEVIEEEPIFVCEEDSYSDFKGQSRESLEILLELIKFNGDLRIIPHDGYIPMDFIPNRLTITLDESENISRTFCG